MLVIASRSWIPQAARTTRPDSYSGPSPSPLLVLVRRVQAIGQAQQAVFFTRMSSVIVSPLMSSACSKYVCWKLRVGSAPMALMMFIITDVPNSGNACGSDRVGLEHLGRFVLHEAEALFVLHLDARLALDHDRFEVLAAHHRAGTAARCRAGGVVHDRGEQHPLLPAGPMQHAALVLVPGPMPRMYRRPSGPIGASRL